MPSASHRDERTQREDAGAEGLGDADSTQANAGESIVKTLAPERAAYTKLPVGREDAQV